MSREGGVREMGYAAEKQPPEVYRERRRRVREKLPQEAVAVLLGGRDDRGYGDVGTFRQEPNFFYLTGVEVPNAFLWLERAREILFLPERKPHLEAWTGPQLGPDPETAQALGLEEVRNVAPTESVVDARRRPVPGFEQLLATRLAQGAELFLLFPPPSASGPLTPELELYSRLRERLPSFPARDLTPVLTQLRLHKEPGELALLEKAVTITAQALVAAAAAVRPGAREGAVEGAAYHCLRAQGAEGWAFPPIVGAGARGCVLHYDANRGTLQAGELVVVDLGARYGYYCGDLTRTFPVSGRFSPRQRQLYDAVLAAHTAAAAALRPGVSLAEVRRAAFEALNASGLEGDGGQPLGEFFLHGIGHFLGLETHDVGGEGPLLAPGMVVTVEPGVYLPQEGVGIRIEDVYVITDEGAQCLTPAFLPRDGAGVESLVGQGVRAGRGE